MTAGIQAPKTDPRDIARQAADEFASGALEVLADHEGGQVAALTGHPRPLHGVRCQAIDGGTRTRRATPRFSDAACRRTLHVFNRPVEPAEAIGEFLTER